MCDYRKGYILFMNNAKDVSEETKQKKFWKIGVGNPVQLQRSRDILVWNNLFTITENFRPKFFNSQVKLSEER